MSVNLLKLEKQTFPRRVTAIWRFLSVAICPKNFRSQQLPMARKVWGQGSDSMHFLCMYRENTYGRVQTVESVPWKSSEFLLQSEVEAGSMERNTSPCPRSPSKRTLLYFSNNSPLKSNFANAPARQLCFPPCACFSSDGSARESKHSEKGGQTFRREPTNDCVETRMNVYTSRIERTECNMGGEFRFTCIDFDRYGIISKNRTRGTQ